MEKEFIATMTWQEFEARLTNLLERQKGSGSDGLELPPTFQEKYLPKKDAARFLSVCPTTVDNFARAGFLKRYYVGRRVLFHVDELRNLVRDTHQKRKTENGKSGKTEGINH